MALDSGAYAAAWAIYDAIGIRPEYLWPVLWSESNLNPSLPNAAGAPFYGINQVAGSYLTKLGIDVADYLTWPASEQLSTVVKPYLAGVVGYTGVVPASGTRLYQANFYPASLNTAPLLSSVIVWAGTSAYAANIGLDPVPRKGAICVFDLARQVDKGASAPSVQAAIAASYAARPSAGPPRDPTYGTDFSNPVLTTLAASGILAAVGALAPRRKRP